MKAEYINGLTINLNEVPVIQFNLNDQDGCTPVIKIATNYEFLQQIHDVIGDCLKQYNARLNFVKAEGKGKGN